MHFSKVHAFFTYKMHALMHAFLRKVSIMNPESEKLAVSKKYVDTVDPLLDLDDTIALSLTTFLTR